ncbi:uncharacterized protein LOC111110699 [Crassostrea virginica]
MKGFMVFVTMVCVLELGTAVYIKRKSGEHQSPENDLKLSDLLNVLKKSMERESARSNDNKEISFQLANETLTDEERDLQHSGRSYDDRKISFQRADGEGQEERRNEKRDFGQNLVIKKQMQPLRKRALSSEAAEFLKSHNDKRRIVSPKATDMLEMVWDDQLESIARSYAKGCNFEHNEARSSSVGYYVGENLYVSTGNISPDVAVTSWDNEKADYDYATDTCDPNSRFGCGHYTQVVWAKSEKVGCVKQFCDKIENFNDRNGNPLSGYLVVCNYGPGGNYNNRKPFTSGTTSCGNCPSGYTCVDRLCSKSSSTGGTTSPCETNPCKNGGSCSAEGGKAVCQCSTGWTGSTCEKQDTPTTTTIITNPCATNPCMNGGSCFVEHGTAKCSCTAEWSGSICQTLTSSVTYSITMICDFEIGMCLQNPMGDWKRFNYFSMNNEMIHPPQGDVFATAYVGNYVGTKYAVLKSYTLPETEVKLSFKYRILGSASLTLVYKEAGQPEVTQVINGKVINGNDSDSWSDWSGYVPAGKDTYFYLKAALSAYTAVAVDDVQYNYSS